MCTTKFQSVHAANSLRRGSKESLPNRKHLFRTHHCLLSILAVVSMGFFSEAHADTWEQPNNAGGKIVLADRVCEDDKYPGLMAAYAYRANGGVTMGCWAVLDEMVHVSWNTGRRSVFSADSFTPGPGNKKSGKSAIAPL